MNSWLRLVTPTLKPKTVETYASLIRSRVVPALGRHRIVSLRPSDIQGWVSGMQADGISASRIRQAHVVLSEALDAAVGDGRIARNAARGVKLPRMEGSEAAFLEPEVVQRIAKSLSEPHDLLVQILGTLGLRWGEAAALRRRSVDILGRRLIIAESVTEVAGRLVFGSTKTHAQRRVPCPRASPTGLSNT